VIVVVTVTVVMIVAVKVVVNVVGTCCIHLYFRAAGWGKERGL
jgi:hypothetical protein